MWSVSDDALLAGLATGDPDAAAAFVERFQRRVFGLAISILRDERGAEDVAQEAFVRAWRHAGAFDPRRGTVVTWLLTITRNLALDVLRLRRPAPVDPQDLIVRVIAVDERGPEEHAVASAEAARVRAAMRDLPESQQRALVLTAFYGRTAREVGESEGVPLGTAKTRIRAGLARLRESLVTEGSSE